MGYPIQASPLLMRKGAGRKGNPQATGAALSLPWGNFHVLFEKEGEENCPAEATSSVQRGCLLTASVSAHPSSTTPHLHAYS